MSVVQDGPREMLVSALSGSFASAVAKVFTHPLETGKTLMVKKKTDENVDDVFKQLRKTGFYIGFREKLCKSMTQKFIYFFLFEGLQRCAMRLQNILRRSRGQKESAKISLAALLISGYLGEALGIPIFAPLDYVAVQVQMSKTREGPVSVVQRTMRETGARGFYMGWQIYLLCALQPMILYPLNQRIRAYMLAGKGDAAVLSAAAAFWLGALSKAIAATATYPINNVRVLMQTASRKKGSAPEQSSAIVADNKDKPAEDLSKTDAGASVLGVFGRVLREEGPLGLYKGLSGELAEGLLGAAPQLLVKEMLTSVTRTAVYATKRR